MVRYNKYNGLRTGIWSKKKSNKFVSVVFISISLLLIIFGVMESKKGIYFKTKIIDYGSFVTYSLSIPIKKISLYFSNMEEIYYIYSQNKKLKNHTLKIKMLENELTLLEHENNLLKDALNIKNDLYYNYQTVKVVAGIRSSFLRTLVILAGKKQKVSEGFTVISNNDLLGHVYESGNFTSRVLLITDINSRVPVIVANKNFRLILSGNNSNYLSILNLGDIDKINSGDIVLTSGDGGVYPQGIAVGVVINDETKKFVVRPNIISRSLDYVRVINWSPQQLANLPIQDVDKLPIFYE